MEEVIYFVVGNIFHVNLNVGEKGKYFRDAKTNIARINGMWELYYIYYVTIYAKRKKEIFITSVKDNFSRCVNAK